MHMCEHCADACGEGELRSTGHNSQDKSERCEFHEDMFYAIHFFA